MKPYNEYECDQCNWRGYEPCPEHHQGVVSSVRSTALLGKIRTAWCHYNALNAEYEYSLSEGGDSDVTRDQVDRAWEDLNSLIMPNDRLTVSGGRKGE